MQRYKSIFVEEVKDRKEFTFYDRQFSYYERNGVLVFNDISLKKLPIESLLEFTANFNNQPYVSSYGFECSYCDQLRDLEGSPQETFYNFSCYKCTSLTSLKGAPRHVGSTFICNECTSLITLKGAPQIVGSSFNLQGCSLITNLVGLPKEIVMYLVCDDCTSLSSLKGMPLKIGHDLYVRNCPNLSFNEFKELKGKDIGSEAILANQNVIFTDYGNFKSVEDLLKPQWPKEFGE